jgi:hypothetical protein
MIKMSKNKITTLLENGWKNGIPFIDYTENYIYCLIPQADGNWQEISYDIPSKELDERIINSTIAFRMIVEEVEKGLSMELEDFMLGSFKDFRLALGDASDQEKLEALIKELTSNGKKYSSSLPVLPSIDKLDEIKSKIT